MDILHESAQPYPEVTHRPHRRVPKCYENLQEPIKAALFSCATTICIYKEYDECRCSLSPQVKPCFFRVCVLCKPSDRTQSPLLKFMTCSAQLQHSDHGRRAAPLNDNVLS